MSSLAYITPTPAHRDGLVASGGMEALIDVRSPTTVELQHQNDADSAARLLVGHSGNVCALDASPRGEFLVSGGWDGAAYLWSLGGGQWERQFELGSQEVLDGGRPASVWAVLAIDERRVVTGSADRKLRIFDLRSRPSGVGRSGCDVIAPMAVVDTGDVVRAVCRVPRGHPTGADFASASNDNVIRLWNLKGHQLAELHGHEGYIYSLTYLRSGEIVSSSEDRTVRVWRGLECIQTITHPARSVWSVAACPTTGDIVTGASDNVVRVFTRAESRVADRETITKFEEAVRSSAVAAEATNQNINKEKLPGREYLQRARGKKDGQTIMVREDDGSVSAHTWSMSKSWSEPLHESRPCSNVVDAGEQRWQHVGTVVDAVGSNNQKTGYLGKMYDFVWDVALEDGAPSYKLPYNLSDNPYEVATKFLADHELPVAFMDDIVKFIRQNTAGATIGGPSDVGGPDPFGTENRYRPGDEFKSSSSAAAPTRAKMFPQATYLTIGGAKFAPIFNKLLSINDALLSTGDKTYALNPADVRGLAALQSFMEKHQQLSSKQPSADTDEELPEYPSGPANVVLSTILPHWPYGDRLAALDLARCLVLASPEARLWADARTGRSILDVAIGAAAPDPSERPGDDATGFSGTVGENHAMMALRLAANLFVEEQGRQVAAVEIDAVLGLMERVVGLQAPEHPAVGKANRNLQIALATAAINFAVLAVKEPELVENKSRNRLLRILAEAAGSWMKDDAEVAFRLLVATGTLLVAGGVESVDRKTARVWAESVKGRVKDDRVARAAAEILAMN